MALVDRTGRLVRFTIRPGNAVEAHELDTLLDGVQTEEVIQTMPMIRTKSDFPSPPKAL